MNLIKKGWHLAYILILIIALPLSIRLAYSQKIAETENEVSTKKLEKSQEKRNGIQILCYHRIIKNNWLTTITKKLSDNNQIHEYSITLSTFKQQLATLKKHHVRIISMRTAETMLRANKKFYHQYVVITFDDCDQTIFENAIPYLEKEQLPYTLFIITGQMNQYNHGSQIVDWAKVQTLKKTSKLVTFGLHTDNLHYWVENKPALMLPENYQIFKKDLRAAQKKLYTKLNLRSNLYAYPYGEATDRIQSYLQKHGYLTFSLDTGIIDNDSATKRSALPRIMVTNKTWKQEVLRWVR